MKCPFLTESLDVLQNLLSDDENSIADDDDVEDSVAADSDQFDIDEDHEVPQAPIRKKRVGRECCFS